jgi:hypothetical protein
MHKPTIDRFMAKVKKSPGGGCWLWTACQSYDGYGYFRLNGKQKRAHRVAFELLVGPIPEGLSLDHLCRVRHCVNPAHLDPVPIKVNILRGQSVSAQNARKTHCPNGHELSDANLYLRSNGRERVCRTCALEWARRYREKQRPLIQEALGLNPEERATLDRLIGKER